MKYYPYFLGHIEGLSVYALGQQYNPCSSHSKAIGLKPKCTISDSWCQAADSETQPFFFSKENLSIILFVFIILTKKINEAVIEKIMPAKSGGI